MPEQRAALPSGARLDMLVLWVLAHQKEPSYPTELLTLVCIKLGDDGMYRSSADEKAIQRSLDRLEAGGLAHHDPDGFGWSLAPEEHP